MVHMNTIFQSCSLYKDEAFSNKSHLWRQQYVVITIDVNERRKDRSSQGTNQLEDGQSGAPCCNAKIRHREFYRMWEKFVAIELAIPKLLDDCAMK